LKIKPFLKWAGGKRWLAERDDFALPGYHGRYIEPFLGGGAMFFDGGPTSAILSDVNAKLIDTYKAIRKAPARVAANLQAHQNAHSKEHYYAERDKLHEDPIEQAAQFLYLNRACWNGLYRENLKGRFNVPIGSKSTVIFPDDDFLVD
jgi:DNA adenine methylase